MDGTTVQTDSSQISGDSSNVTEETPTEHQTFTREMRDKAVNDALAAAGRTAKALQADKQSLKAERDAIAAERATWQKERDEAEEFDLREDPEALRTLRAERRRKTEDATRVTQLTEREAKLAARETEIAEIVERDRTSRRTKLASDVAQEKGVSAESILKLAREDTREAYEEIAALLPKSKELPVLVSHSGRTTGGGGKRPSLEEVRAVSPEDWQKKLNSGEWIR